MRKFEDQVRAADRLDVEAFAKNKIFKLQSLQSASLRPCECIWVRRWKWESVGNNRVRLIKSRLCVRGYLDP